MIFNSHTSTNILGVIIYYFETIKHRTNHCHMFVDFSTHVQILKKFQNENDRKVTEFHFSKMFELNQLLFSWDNWKIIFLFISKQTWNRQLNFFGYFCINHGERTHSTFRDFFVDKIYSTLYYFLPEHFFGTPVN